MSVNDQYTGSCHDVALCWLPDLLWRPSWLDLTCFWRSRGQFGQWVILARILRFCQGWSSNCLLNYLAHSIVFYTVCRHLFALAGGISVNSDTGALLVSEMTLQRSSSWPINHNSLSRISPESENCVGTESRYISHIWKLHITLYCWSMGSLGTSGNVRLPQGGRHHINLVIGTSNYWCSCNCSDEEENIVTF